MGAMNRAHTVCCCRGAIHCAPTSHQSENQFHNISEQTTIPSPRTSTAVRLPFPPQPLTSLRSVLVLSPSCAPPNFAARAFFCPIGATRLPDLTSSVATSVAASAATHVANTSTADVQPREPTNAAISSNQNKLRTPSHSISPPATIPSLGTSTAARIPFPPPAPNFAAVRSSTEPELRAP